MSAVPLSEVVEALIEAKSWVMEEDDFATMVADIVARIEQHGIAPPDGMVLVENKPIGYCNLNEVKQHHKKEQSALLWGRNYPECDAVVYATPEVKP